MNHAAAANLVRLAISACGGIVLPYTTGGFLDLNGRLIRVGKVGASDLIACVRGRFVAAEVKVGKDRQRPEQQKFQAAIERAGGLYVLCRFEPGDGVATIKDALNAL